MSAMSKDGIPLRTPLQSWMYMYVCMYVCIYIVQVCIYVHLYRYVRIMYICIQMHILPFRNKCIDAHGLEFMRKASCRNLSSAVSVYVKQARGG